MLIVCPSCASEYTIDPAKLGAEGRTVRCAICRDTWFVPGIEQAGGEADSPQDTAEAVETAPPPAPEVKAQPRPRRKRRLVAGFAVVAGVLAVLALLSSRPVQTSAAALVRHAAAFAGSVGTKPKVEFREVTAELIGSEPERVLVVVGEIANSSEGEAQLSPLEFSVRNAADQVLYTWTNAPPRQTLAAGETARFETRLTSPPTDGRQVHVHFASGSGFASLARRMP